MSKSKEFHREAKTSRGLIRKLQSLADRARPIPFAGRPQTIQDLFYDEAEGHQLHDTDETELRPPNPYLPDGEGTEITLFDSMATGYFAPEAVQARQIAKVREALRRENGPK